MNAHLILLIISASASFILSLLIISRTDHKKQDWLFGITTLAASLWTASHIGVNLFGFLYPTLLRITYVIASFIFSTLFLFITFFTKEKIRHTRGMVFLVMGINIIIAAIAAIPGLVVDTIIITRGGEIINITLGPYYFLFSLYLSIFALMVLGRMAHAYYLFSGIKRVQIAFMFLGTIVASVIGFSTDLILPAFGIFQYMGKGPVAIMIFSFSIYYAIFKYNLLNIRVIAAEIFSGLILVTTFLNLLTAETRTEVVEQSLILLALIVFAYFLVRSVAQEIKAKEEISRLVGNLRLANEELRRLDKAKSEFISIASHQLRTPLSVIKGYISMIMEEMFGKIQPQMRTMLDRVYTSNERLIKLVGDMLNLSRIEAGRMQYDIKLVPIDEIVLSIIHEFEHAAQEKHIELRWENPKSPLVIRADKDAFREVLMNLIDNAIRYTDEGYVRIFVIPATPGSKYAVIGVQDSGAGIDREEMTHLFKQFERGDAGREKGITGFGFGLYVAKKIVEEGHHGKIWAESAGKGKGTTFFVQIPLAK